MGGGGRGGQPCNNKGWGVDKETLGGSVEKQGEWWVVVGIKGEWWAGHCVMMCKHMMPFS